MRPGVLQVERGPARRPRRPMGPRILEQVWAQRLLFGAAGLFVGVACAAWAHVTGPGWRDPLWAWPTWHAALDRWVFARSWTFLQSVPLVALVLVVLLRRARGSRWRWVSFTVGLVLTPLQLLATAHAASAIRAAWSQTSFSTAAWTAPGASAGARSWMVRSLIRDVGLAGRPVSDVDALLGRDDPSNRHECRDVGSAGPAPWDRAWRLGHEPGRPAILRVRLRAGAVHVVEVHECGASCEDPGDLCF